MGETRIDNVKVKSTVDANTEKDLAPLVCPACNLCARFRPCYRFNSSGVMSQIVLGGRPMIQCCECNAVYVWQPPTSPKAHDGGWERASMLDDRESVV